MKALVIGYGSIGKRHCEVLKQMGLDVAIVSRRKLSIVESYKSIQEAFQQNEYNYIVIANETSLHEETLNKILALNYIGPILVEKPLFINYREFKNNLKDVFVAYNLRYHPLLQKLKELLNGEKVLSVNAYVGQYLPTWRPNTDYSKGYSAFTNLGGGVLRDLSHEIDYLTLLFGEWRTLHANAKQISNLSIQSEDYVQMAYETNRNVHVSLEMNYLDHIIQRYVTIQTDNKTIKVDFIQNTINFNGELLKLEPIDRDYTYQKQHEGILNGSNLCCTFEEGLKVMKMIEAVEQSSLKREWVYND